MNLGSSDCSSFLRKEKRNPFMKTKSFGRINMAIAVNTSRFEGVTMAPPDPILGVSEAFRADNSEMKLNLGVGAYRTEELQPYVLNVVKKYLPIEGLAAFNKVTAELLFGAGNPVIEQQRVATVQGLSGTGSLRLAAALIERYFPGAKVLISSPTWGNHKNIFNDARVPWSEYRYYDPKTVGLDFDGMISDIKSQFSETLIPSGHLLFRPSFIPAKSLWPSLNPTISLSGHLSFRSSVPVLRAKGENAFQSVKSSSQNIHRRQLFRRQFFLHRKERLEEISNFSQSTGAKKPSKRRPRAFFRPAREPLSSDALPPPGSPDADQPPFLPVSSIRALHWSQSVLLFICGKGKDEYLTGEAAMPETTEPGFKKWKIENSMIMSWLINSMNNDIGENFLLFGTTKDIWDATKETYSSSKNTSELF
uniref:Aminotransferase class I/classII large domain-containing protein n=1 Tax=Vitis vinifera TaxID=29760 RepID=A5AKW6_VITVI|nr:hypothetical protein VITISV_034785 [Vitis vinifera]